MKLLRNMFDKLKFFLLGYKNYDSKKLFNIYKQFLTFFYTGFIITRCTFFIEGKKKSNTYKSYKLNLVYRFYIKLE